MELEFKGRRVLVTGATGGVGRATVLAFAGAGADVVAAYHRNKAAADDLVSAAAGLPGRVEPVQADITDEEAVQRLADACGRLLGGLDVLVNNAGVDGSSAIAELDRDEWRRVVDLNLTGSFLVTRAVFGLLAEGAAVVNVGASVALRGRPESAHYTASKSALIGLTRTLAKEAGRRGIRVNLIDPGVIDTGDGPPPPVRERLKAMTALGRLAEPADVTGAVLFLASDLSRFVTGATLTVDGGM
ncbi:SDR family NAD(P)-dependent oxidoreductase [Paractinoplanes ferrugineus]|uniref:Short-chain dehydrogenase n=1 Tax=Paractinoplanes ferrugineus TaxID=113564 RepID=A0A919MMY0_9ACTN|nr:SDR family NAD(P)-dependent oxidoreductase [Actinoplanes ferrugineus]GIE13727.1 short-chain dehydrogenase [Actinoplanes ferrugineus]